MNKLFLTIFIILTVIFSGCNGEFDFEETEVIVEEGTPEVRVETEQGIVQEREEDNSEVYVDELSEEYVEEIEDVESHIEYVKDNFVEIKSNQDNKLKFKLGEETTIKIDGIEYRLKVYETNTGIKVMANGFELPISKLKFFLNLGDSEVELLVEEEFAILYITNNEELNLNIRCTDSDGGKNYFSIGEVKGREKINTNKEIEAKEYCVLDKESNNELYTENHLVEYSCKYENGISYVEKEIYYCPGGCKNGACVQMNYGDYIYLVGEKDEKRVKISWANDIKDAEYYKVSHSNTNVEDNFEHVAKIEIGEDKLFEDYHPEEGMNYYRVYAQLKNGSKSRSAYYNTYWIPSDVDYEKGNYVKVTGEFKDIGTDKLISNVKPCCGKDFYFEFDEEGRFTTYVNPDHFENNYFQVLFHMPEYAWFGFNVKSNHEVYNPGSYYGNPDDVYDLAYVVRGDDGQMEEFVDVSGKKSFDVGTIYLYPKVNVQLYSDIPVKYNAFNYDKKYSYDNTEIRYGLDGITGGSGHAYYKTNHLVNSIFPIDKKAVLVLEDSAGKKYQSPEFLIPYSQRGKVLYLTFNNGRFKWSLSPVQAPEISFNQVTNDFVCKEEPLNKNIKLTMDSNSVKDLFGLIKLVDVDESSGSVKLSVNGIEFKLNICDTKSLDDYEFKLDGLYSYGNDEFDIDLSYEKIN